MLLLFCQRGVVPVNKVLLPFEIGFHTVVLDIVVVFVLCLFHSFNGFVLLLVESGHDLFHLRLLLGKTAAHALDGLLQDRLRLTVFLGEFRQELLDGCEVGLLKLVVKVLYFV
jgi:hypothetical protein